MSDTFIELLSQHGNKTVIQALTADKLKQLESCADNALIDSIKGVNAIGELIYWSCKIEEPPIESIGQIGLVIKSMSELMIKADFLRSEALYCLKNS